MGVGLPGSADATSLPRSLLFAFLCCSTSYLLSNSTKDPCLQIPPASLPHLLLPGGSSCVCAHIASDLDAVLYVGFPMCMPSASASEQIVWAGMEVTKAKSIEKRIKQCIICYPLSVVQYSTVIALWSCGSEATFPGFVCQLCL